jgi:2,3-bisphosphoglycerate-independent phosphoglycerate mutase
MALGSGRILLQDLCKIDKHLDEILDQEQVASMIRELKASKKACHIIGLASDGGVHSHINHVLRLAQHVLKHEVPVKLHLITDGRDTLPRSALKFLKRIDDVMANAPLCSIATLGGRYYAMDRDKRFDRTEQAYRVITGLCKARTFSSAVKAVSDSYTQGVSDEFIQMQSHVDYTAMEHGDAVIFANFRADRMRQLFEAMCSPYFDGFVRKDRVEFSRIVAMTPYAPEVYDLATVLFQPEKPKNILSDVLHQQNLSQLRVAETEKYPHVTFFFDATREQPYPNEKRIFINSPKVFTYDQAPGMSAVEITDELIKSAANESYDFILLNYANADMVGHTGNFDATVQAVKVIDACLKRLYSSLVKNLNFTLVIVGDHGNAECMFDEANCSAHTAHTTNPVPFIVASQATGLSLRSGGSLCDVAPTILNLMKLNKPSEMTGTDLFESQEELIKEDT